MIKLLFAIIMCTGSMEPTFMCGDRVPLTSDFNLTVGDVYVYDVRYNNRSHYIIHRLVGINGSFATFKGDNAPNNETIKTELIKYKVIEK